MSSTKKECNLYNLVLEHDESLPAPPPRYQKWFLGLISYKVEDAVRHVTGKDFLSMTDKDELESALIALIEDLDRGDQGYLSDKVALSIKNDYVIKTDTDHLFENKTPEALQNKPSFPGYARYVGDQERARQRDMASAFLLHLRAGYRLVFKPL